MIKAVKDPPAVVWTEPMQNLPGLAIRHPGFGWLNFLLSKDQGRRLAADLLKQAVDAKKPPERSN